MKNEKIAPKERPFTTPAPTINYDRLYKITQNVTLQISPNASTGSIQSDTAPLVSPDASRYTPEFFSPEAVDFRAQKYNEKFMRNFYHIYCGIEEKEVHHKQTHRFWKKYEIPLWADRLSTLAPAQKQVLAERRAKTPGKDKTDARSVKRNNEILKKKKYVWDAEKGKIDERSLGQMIEEAGRKMIDTERKYGKTSPLDPIQPCHSILNGGFNTPAYKREKMAFIRKVALFRFLEADKLQLIASRLNTSRHEPGHIITIEGEPKRCVYFVKSGLVAVYRNVVKMSRNKDLECQHSVKMMQDKMGTGESTSPFPSKVLVGYMGEGDFWNEESALYPKSYVGAAITTKVAERAVIGMLDSLGDWTEGVRKVEGGASSSSASHLSTYPPTATPPPLPFACLSDAEVAHAYQVSRLTGAFRKLQRRLCRDLARETKHDPTAGPDTLHSSIPKWSLLQGGDP